MIEKSIYVKNVPERLHRIDESVFGDGILGEDYDWSSHPSDDYPIELKMGIEIIEPDRRSCCNCYFDSGEHRSCKIARLIEEENEDLNDFFCSNFEPESYGGT